MQQQRVGEVRVCGLVHRILLTLENCAMPLAGQTRDTSHRRVRRPRFTQLTATRGAKPLLELGLDGLLAAMVLLGAIQGALLKNPGGDASALFLVCRPPTQRGWPQQGWSGRASWRSLRGWMCGGIVGLRWVGWDGA